MTDLEVRAGTRRRKKIIRLSAFVGGAVLVGLTLFSNTLHGLTLPKVTTDQPTIGVLEPAFTGEATVHYADLVELVNPGGGRVEEVLVKEGEAVAKGQELVRYANEEMSLQIDAEQASLEKLRLALPGLRRAFIEAARTDDANAQEEARIALENIKIDAALQEKRIQELRRQALERSELKAPFDGIIVAVHAVEGLPSGTKAAADIRLADLNKGLRFEIRVPKYLAMLLKVGDPIGVTVGEEGRVVQGNVAEIGERGESDGRTAEVITPNAAVTPGDSASPAMRLLVGLNDTQLHDGDRVEMKLSAKETSDAVIVSSRAVHEDMNGAYVFAVDMRQGPLGNTAYARKIPVTVIGVNGSRTAVSEGLFGDESIILDSSEPLADGVQVRS